MENSAAQVMKCFYEEDFKAAEEMINQFMLRHAPPADFTQFKQDCGYYYSKVLNRPIIAPTVLQFDYMRRCQLQCRICKIWSRQATKPEEELTCDELKGLFDQAADMGVSQCYFSGGEPFMLPYLFEILHYARGKSIYTEVTTNGLLLTEENCRKLIDLPLNQLNISIDGASPSTHDYHRNKPGLFKAVIKNLKRLVRLRNRKKSLYPIINMACVLTNKNFHEMLTYVKLARKIGVVAFFQTYASENDNFFNRTIEDEFVVPADRLPALYSEIDKVIEYKRKCRGPYFLSNSIDSLQSLKEYFAHTLAPAKYCFAGFNRIIILKDRKVNLCPGEAGDFSKNTLREIWYSKQAEEVRKMTYTCAKPCFMGSAYYPGPSVNDIFLISKRHLITLWKSNSYDEPSLTRMSGHLESYKAMLREHSLSNEIEKLESILGYLHGMKDVSSTDRKERK